jgi:hypothetical protein
LEGEIFVPYSVPMGVTMAMPPASSAPVVGELWQAAQSAARNTCRPRSNSFCFCSALMLAKSTVAGGTLPLALPAIYMPPSTTTAAAAMPAAILVNLLR